MEPRSASHQTGQHEVERTGPIDNMQRFTDGPVASAADCPTEQEYMGHVELEVSRTVPGTSQGYMNLSAVDASASGQLELALRPVTCSSR